MNAAMRSSFTDLLGPGGVADGDAVLPATPEQMGAVCGMCARSGTAMTVISGPDAAELAVVRGILVSLARMTETTVDLGAQMVHAGAGAMLAAVRSAAGHQGLAVVGMGAGGPQHVGSAIARGTIGARGLAGLDLVLSSGRRITVGGRALVDVTGYHLGGLMLGSMGALAVVVGASLRLVPAGCDPASGVAAGQPGAHPLVAALTKALDPDGRFDPIR